MKERLTAVMREFYHDGIPAGIVPRDVEYVEKLRASTVVKGMRRTGKTFVTYERMSRLISEGVPLGRIVHVNFDDERLSRIPIIAMTANAFKEDELEAAEAGMQAHIAKPLEVDKMMATIAAVIDEHGKGRRG